MLLLHAAALSLVAGRKAPWNLGVVEVLGCRCTSSFCCPGKLLFHRVNRLSLAALLSAALTVAGIASIADGAFGTTFYFSSG